MAARRPWLLLLLLVLVLATEHGDARKSKKAKAKVRRGSGGGGAGTLADAQSLLRAGQGRAAADALLVSGGVSGGVAGLTSSKAMTTDDEWELYTLGASLVREHSGSQAAVLAGVEVLKQVVRQAGQAATPAQELASGTQHKIVGNTSPCKQSKTAPGCRPFSTRPLAPLAGEQARVRRDVRGWLGERLQGAVLGETVAAASASDGAGMSATLLSQEPFVATIGDFLSPSEAAHLVSAASQAIHSRIPGGDLCVKPERLASLGRAREAAHGAQGVKNSRGWSCWPLATGGVGDLVSSTSVQVDRGVDPIVDAIDERILAAIGASGENNAAEDG